jgi:uncharacterized protein YdcH (DUF465 family)
MPEAEYRRHNSEKRFEKIEKIINENTKRIEILRNTDWYDNKELYEMISKLKTQFGDFNENFHKYNGLVEKYNGLITQQQNLNEKITNLEKIKLQIKTEKNSTEKTNNSWGVWIIRIIAFLSTTIAFVQYIGG